MNNVVSTRLNLWDITFIREKLKLYQKNHDIFIEIDFNVTFSIYIRKGYLFYNHKGFRVYSDYLKILKNVQLTKVTFTNLLVGISMRRW